MREMKPLRNHEVNIPFQPDFREPMLSGKKTVTTRTTCFGRPGDRFPAFGRTFLLTEVYRTPLYSIVFNHYREEGFASPQAFVECWNKIHWQVIYTQRPARPVYLHRFTITQKAYPQTRTVESHMPLAGVAHPK